MTGSGCNEAGEVTLGQEVVPRGRAPLVGREVCICVSSDGDGEENRIPAAATGSGWSGIEGPLADRGGCLGKAAGGGADLYVESLFSCWRFAPG